MDNKMTDYYKILGVPPTATRKELKQRYHQLARKHHPDKGTIPGQANPIHNINMAWDILGDDTKRKKYDAQLKASSFVTLKAVQEHIELSEAKFNVKENQYERDCRCGGQYVFAGDDVKDDVLMVDCDSCSLSIFVDCKSVECKKPSNVKKDVLRVSDTKKKELKLKIKLNTYTVHIIKDSSCQTDLPYDSEADEEWPLYKGCQCGAAENAADKEWEAAVSKFAKARSETVACTVKADSGASVSACDKNLVCGAAVSAGKANSKSALNTVEAQSGDAVSAVVTDLV